MADAGPLSCAVRGRVVKPTIVNPCWWHGSGVTYITMYNTLYKRKGGLESATHALDLVAVHIVVVQETKFTKVEFTTKR